jgi:uncharacterized protein YihD (DUF1040 family)
MRDPERIDRMVEKLTILWKKYPDFRLTQLMWELGRSEYTFFYVEDKYIEEKLDRCISRGKIE